MNQPSTQTVNASNSATMPAPSSVVTPQTQAPVTQAVIKTASKPVDALEVNKKTKSILQLGSIVVFILIVINGLVIQLTRTKLNQINLLKQQVITTRQNSIDLQNAVEFLDRDLDQIQALKAVLPKNETDFARFIRILEIIASNSVGQITININSISGEGQTSHVPFTMKFATSLNNLQDFLASLEKLPYLVELTSIQTSQIDSDADVWNITLSSRLYVRDDFGR